MNTTHQAEAEKLIADIQSERDRLSRFPHNPVAANRRRWLLGKLQEIGLQAVDSWERISRMKTVDDSRAMDR